MTLVYGDIVNKTRNMSTQDFEIVRERIRDTLMGSREFRRHFRIVESKARYESLRAREHGDQGGRELNPAFTYFLNGNVMSSERETTKLFYLNFQLLRDSDGGGASCARRSTNRPTTERARHIFILPFAMLALAMPCACSTPGDRTTRLTTDDFTEIAQVADRLRASEFLRDRTPSSPPIAITVVPPVNYTSDIMTQGERMYVMQSVLDSLAVRSAGPRTQPQLCDAGARLRPQPSRWRRGTLGAAPADTHARATFRSATYSTGDARTDAYYCQSTGHRPIRRFHCVERSLRVKAPRRGQVLQLKHHAESRVSIVVSAPAVCGNHARRLLHRPERQAAGAAVNRADYPAARDILYPTLEKTTRTTATTS